MTKHDPDRASERVGGFGGAKPHDEEIDRELAFHVEMRVRELTAKGMAPADARREALRRFGDYEHSRRECAVIDARRHRQMTRANYLRDLAQDLRYAIRQWRRTPGFTTVAILTLALGIGANSAIFSVVHGVALQPLPYPDPDRLVRIGTLYPDGTSYSLSAPDFVSIREEAQAFERIEAISGAVVPLRTTGDTREVQNLRVSDGLFSLLGLRVSPGRAFSLDEHQPGRAQVAVLSRGFWRREFGGAEEAVGRTISISGLPHTVIGVLAEDVWMPTAADVYLPLEYTDAFSAATDGARRSEFLTVIGRMKPGVAAAAADADVRRIGTALQTRFPNTNARQTFDAVPLDGMLLGNVRTPLFVLLGAVGFVLVVACANVASLLLARDSARHQELSMRTALGAGRWRLFRQLLTESILLGLAGGVVGLGLAYAGTRLLLDAQPAGLPRLQNISVNGTVVLVTMGLSVLTGLVFGVIPAVQASRRSIVDALREGGRSGSAGRAAQRARTVLVVAEVALAVTLLTGAGLLIRSFAEMMRVPAGFNAEHAVAFRLTLQGPAYQRAQDIRTRIADLEGRLRAVPGVSATAVTTVLPFGGRGGLVDFAVDGAPPPPPHINPEIAIASVSPGYFDTLGTPLRSGRAFTDGDTAESPLVALVNETTVARWFDGRDPIGRTVTAAGQQRLVVGVVGDVLQRDPQTPIAPMLFTPYAQRVTRTIRVIVRSSGDPMAQEPAIRSAIRAADPDLAIAAFGPLTELQRTSTAQPRFYTSLMTLFAAVALVLAATGIFGVMSYTVAQRSREIGIRIALGASTRGVLGRIVGRAMVVAGVGLIIGLAGAVALGSGLQSLVFGVGLTDPTTFAAVGAVLLGTAVVAALLPARRAARVDPAIALRNA